MCVHIRQSVREQPDTGYWKCQRAAFATARLNGGMGRGVGVVFNMRLRLMYGEVSVGKGEGV